MIDRGRSQTPMDYHPVCLAAEGCQRSGESAMRILETESIRTLFPRPLPNQEAQQGWLSVQPVGGGE
jgi:hypothetical protein